MRINPYKCRLFLSALILLLFGLFYSTNVPAKENSLKPLIWLDSIIYKNFKNRVKVAIPLSRNVHVFQNRLSKPDRVYVDIFDSRIGSELKRINRTYKESRLVKKINAAQNRKDKVRIVFYLKKNVDFLVFKSKNRLEIIFEKIIKKKKVVRRVKKKKVLKNKKTLRKKRDKRVIKKVSKNFNFKIKDKIIVIDPGHGGKDPGAVGRGGLKEKDIVLDLALRLKKLIKTKIGCKVILTRDSDIFIPVRKRPQIAKKINADLFVSLHINADTHKKTNGIETYYLSPATSKKELEIAARENMVTFNDMEKNALEFILADMASTYKINESIILANHVQRFLIKGLQTKYSKIKNLGVKKGPFYVLANTDMPSILVETMFITNPNEEKRLRKNEYRETIAKSVFYGLEQYIKRIVIASASK